MNSAVQLYWVSEDGQSGMMMGEFGSKEEALKGIPAAEQEIIDQGGEPDGSWHIEEVTESDY